MVSSLNGKCLRNSNTLLLETKKAIHLNYSFWPSHILKTNSITNFVTQLRLHLFTNSFCNTHSCNTSWLGATNNTIYSVAVFMQILSTKSKYQLPVDKAHKPQPLLLISTTTTTTIIITSYKA